MLSNKVKQVSSTRVSQRKYWNFRGRKESHMHSSNLSDGVEPDMLAKMQHDIRSPLGSILGLSDVLSATASTPEQEKMAAILKSSSEDLNRQIDALFKVLTQIQN